MSGTIVTDLRVLKAMAKANLILLDDDTGKPVRHWTGAVGKATYIWDAVKANPFTYKGVQYKVQYFDGCFKPFVCRVGEPLPSFV